jgi:hypothetical protein
MIFDLADQRAFAIADAQIKFDRVDTARSADRQVFIAFSESAHGAAWVNGSSASGERFLSI